MDRMTPRGKIAVVLSALLLIGLPAGGLVGGLYLGFERAQPNGPVCGMWWMPATVIVTAMTVAGTVVGLVVAWLITLGLIRWANGCGLSDILPEPTMAHVWGPEDAEDNES